MERKTTPIIIGSYYNAYGIARSFQDAGIKSILLTNGEENFVEDSKYIQERYIIADANKDENKCIRDLIEIGKKIAPAKGMLFPTHDEYVLAIARHESELNEYFEIPQPNYETLASIMSKASFSKICRDLDIPVIEERKATNYKEAVAAGKDLRFPIIVKADIWDLNVARALDGKNIIFKGHDSYIEKMERIYSSNASAEILIQEYIQTTKLMPNVNSVCDRNGNMQCVFVSTKPRQYPPRQGVSTLTYAVDPEDQEYKDIIEYSKSVTKAIKYYGLLGIEFIWDDRDETYKVVEMNCRSEFPNYLQTMVGQNMPYYLYSYHLGEKTNIPYYPQIKEASCYVPVQDKLYSTILNKYYYPEFAITKAEWRKSIRKPCTLYGLAKDDRKAKRKAYKLGYKNFLSLWIRGRFNIPATMSIREFLLHGQRKSHN